MLRFLVQVYSMENRDRAARKMLLETASSLMHAVAAIAGLLTKLPANRDFPGTTAGISFALDRYFTPSELTSEKLLIVERLDEILQEVKTLRNEAADQPANERKVGGEFAHSLESVENVLRKLKKGLGASSL
jgi:hypothetical protein